ncbi:MAG TPA: agmatine deiminase family protein [Gemmatimonadaceae bacterium]|nr:agmatine deiminase family protein [Gemmatimonadaceae bacterium]
MTDVRPAATLRAHNDAAPASKYVMPAEWEPHDATWIAWPHHEPDWPGKLGAIPWVYAEIVRALHAHERVEILCNDSFVHDTAAAMLDAHDVSSDAFRLHIVPTDRVWLRDSAPTFVWQEDGSVALVNWHFNAWAKYDNYSLDNRVGEAIERITSLERIIPLRPDTREQIVLEGGGIEANGAGRLLVTEEWLLSDVQIRNRGITREQYNDIFRNLLGADETIWLGNGAAGDDTHGHIDDIARFTSADTVLLAFEENEHDANAKSSRDNLRRLEDVSRGRQLRVVKLPYPRAVMMSGQRLPASYANFYIANNVVLVPTFNDKNDRIALDIIAGEFPDREIIGIHSVDLVWGLGTLHCLTQQQPAPRGHGSSGAVG